MRAILISAVILVAALAGCSSKKGDDEHLHYTCPDGTEIHGDDYEGVLQNITVDFLKTKCPKGTGTGTGSTTNTTSQAPNVLPNLVLNVTNFEGTATNVTFVDGNLTFSAAGSNDPDGQISAIAISVKDSNRTQTKSLYDFATKTFTPATFTFDRAGVVNVSVAMVDDRAGFASIATFAYVNEQTKLPADNLPVATTSTTTPVTHPCKGADQGDQSNLIDSPYFKLKSVTIVEGATFIEAIPGASNLVTICDPTGTAISPAKQSSATTSTVDLVVPPSTDNYGIGVYVTAPNTAINVNVIVHYEPRPAAEA